MHGGGGPLKIQPRFNLHWPNRSDDDGGKGGGGFDWWHAAIICTDYSKFIRFEKLDYSKNEGWIFTVGLDEIGCKFKWNEFMLNEYIALYRARMSSH